MLKAIGLLLALLLPPSHADGVPQDQVDAILADVEKEFSPDFEKLGLRLHVRFDGSFFDTQMHSITYKWGDAYIYVGTGLVQNTSLTPDALRLIISHEIGHTLGGWPYLKKGPFHLFARTGSSSEGQADYYAGHEGMKRLLKNKVDSQLTDRDLSSRLCESPYPTPTDFQICVRTLRAALIISKIQARLSCEKTPHLDTPSTERVRTRAWKHPSAQCTLDTYVAGALQQTRPACWFKP